MVEMSFAPGDPALEVDFKFAEPLPQTIFGAIQREPNITMPTPGFAPNSVYAAPQVQYSSVLHLIKEEDDEAPYERLVDHSNDH